MRKENEMEYKEVCSKIITKNDMFYTLNIHSREEVLELKKIREEQTTEKVTEESIIDELINEDICHLVTAESLIYLPYETKIINKNEIKESLVEYR